MTTSYDSEFSYLNREAEEDCPETTEEELEEIRFQANFDAYCEQQAEFEELGLKYLVMADLNGTEEPF